MTKTDHHIEQTQHFSKHLPLLEDRRQPSRIMRKLAKNRLDITEDITILG